MRERREAHWYSLQLLSLYRLFVALVLLVLAASGSKHMPLPALFLVSAITYLALAISWAISSRWLTHHFHWQIYAQFITDLILLITMVHASGDLQNTLSIPLIVSVAGSCLLLRRIAAYLIATIAALALLGNTSYLWYHDQVDNSMLTNASLLSVAFLGIALLTNRINRQLRETETRAEQSQRALLNLEKLNALIIEQFQSGIIAINPQQQIQLINDTAKKWLQTGSKRSTLTLMQLSPELSAEFTRWQQNKLYTPGYISGCRLDLVIKFIELATDNTIVLVILNDAAELDEELQRRKLASMERFTASIAHEIRNPLSAISHAGQLLAESDTLHHQEQRLTEIIEQQSKRLNKIVENIMQLSQKSRIQRQDIDLPSWLKQFCIDFCTQYTLPENRLTLDIGIDQAIVHFNPSQLSQILSNLCENSLKYGTTDAKQSVNIELRCNCDPVQQRLFINICDHGEGIDAEIVEHIFDPFFSTDANSTGLGLYICHELCSLNQARLTYTPPANGAYGYFRILFKAV